MALLALDGTAYYDDGTMSQRATITSTPQVDPTGGVFNSVHRNGEWICNSNSDNIKIITTNTDPTFIYQANFLRAASPIVDVGQNLRFNNDGEGVDHVGIWFWGDGGIEVRNNSGASLERSFGNAYHLDKWNYLEFKVLISDTVGTIDLKCNGRNIINLTSQDTKNGGTNSWVDSVSYNRGGEGTFSVSNAVFMNGAGGTFDDFLGPRRIYTLFPSVNNSVAWTRSSTSSTNWELVDEFEPDSDTTYVESATTGDIDMYGFTDLSTTATSVDAIAVNISARETATTAGTNMRVRVNSTGSVDLGATITLSSVYSIYQTIFSTNPAGGSWNTGDVDSILVGIEVVA